MHKPFILVLLVLFTSCASLHTPSNHFVPAITKKNQAEAEFSVSNALSVSAAYSPLNHLSVMANIQTMPKINAPTYQRSGELALGYYGNTEKIVYGINGSFGIGAFNWEYSQASDTSSYKLLTKGVFQKIALQPFLAFTDNSANPSWFSGISLKVNYFMDQFNSLVYSYEETPGFVGHKTNVSIEPCIFTKNYFSKKFYLNGQAGINISYDETMFWPTQYVFLRVGIGFKL